MVRVKICGLTRADHARAASRAGADAIGAVVLAPRSARDVSIEHAEEVLRATGPYAVRVLVTPDADLRRVLEAAERIKPDVLQLSGPLEPSQARKVASEVGARLVLTAALDQPDNARHARELAQHADAILVDACSSDGYGGTGVLVDWREASRVRASTPTPMILAGGLTPENVAEAIRAVQPYAVDVSSGVEDRPGSKDISKVERFIRQARSVTA